MNLIIRERRGKFLVGYIEKRRTWLFGREYEKFTPVSKDGVPYILAEFETLQEARDFVTKVKKPDVLHEV